MTVDLYESIKRAKMLSMQKDNIQNELNTCLSELKDLKIKNQELNRIKHENSDMRVINKWLSEEQASLKVDRDAKRSTIKT